MFQYFNQLNGVVAPSWVIKIDSAVNDQLDCIQIDNNGFGHASGYHINNSTDLVYFEFSESGEIARQVRVDASSVDGSTGIAFNNDSVYVVGYTNSAGAGSFDLVLVKFNRLGEIQWQKTYGTASLDGANDIKLLSNGDPIIVGSNGTNIVITRITASTGSINWQKKVDLLSTTSGVGNFLQGVYIDSSDNIYITSDTTIGVLTYKITSAGVATWQKKIGDSLVESLGAITVDNSGNVYNFAYDSTAKSVFLKYSSGGTLSLQRYISGSNGTPRIYGATSKDNFIYAVGHDDAYGFIIKFDTSGVIQWQRRLVPPSGSFPRWHSISIDNLGYYYIAGYSTTPGNFSSWISKFPIDGSLTGTYGGYVYEASAYTTSTSTIAESNNAGYTLSNITLTTNTPTFTVSDPQIAWTKTILGT